MSALTNPHDHFFKATFSQPDIAADFLARWLPPAVAEHLDFSTLTLQKGSFVDEQLQEHFADLLYRVQWREEEEVHQVLVYLLLEHKSYVDPLTPFQLLRYLVRIWAEQSGKGEGLLPIIPVVVYHGRQSWELAPAFDSLFSGPEGLRRYWPSFEYDLVDLSAIPDEQIEGAIRQQVAVLLLKHIFSPDLAERLPHIFALLRELADQETALQYLETLLRYVAAGSERIEPEDLAQAIRQGLELPEGEMMPTLAERWIEEGREQGLEQGLERGLEEAILEALEVRFGPVPAGLVEMVEAIDTPAPLRELLRAALTAKTLDDFRRALEEHAD